MKKLQVFIPYFLVVFLFASAAKATDSSNVNIDFYAGPKPLAIIIETDKWADMTNHTLPEMALYENGLLIRRIAENDYEYHYVKQQLSPEKLSELKERLLSTTQYEYSGNYYDLAQNTTDQPTTMIFTDIDGKSFTTNVRALTTYERLAEEHRQFEKTHPNLVFGKGNDSIPISIKKIYSYLTTLPIEDTSVWIPDYVEVLVWSYPGIKGKSFAWPKEWPGLNSPYATVSYYPYINQLYTIYLPGTELGKLRTVIKHGEKRRLVEMDHKKLAIDLRYAFPNQKTWWDAFEIVWGNYGTRQNVATSEDKILITLAGSWEVARKNEDFFGSGRSESIDSCKFTFILDSSALALHYNELFRNQQVSEEGMLCWNVLKSQWEMATINGIQPELVVYTGKLSDNGTIVFESKSDLLGFPSWGRITWKNIIPNHFDEIIESSTDSGKTWIPVSTAIFTKKL